MVHLKGSHLVHMAVVVDDNLVAVEEYIAVEVFPQLINNFDHMVERLVHIAAVVVGQSAIA